MNALMNPVIRKGANSGVIYIQFFIKEIPLAPAMIGTAMMNVKSEAAL